MGKQLDLFPPSPLDADADARLNAAQAELRRERLARQATRVYARRGRHRFSRFDAARFSGPELDE